MINVFNRFYQGYDDWLDTAPGSLADQVETRALMDSLNPQPSQAILEVGCGTGIFTCKLAALGCRMTGVDIAPNMLDQARSKLRQAGFQADLRLMDITDMQGPEGSFDAAFSMACFEFLPDMAAAYQAMRKLVRPGGSIVIGSIQHGGAWADLYESPACRGTAYEYAHFPTAEDLMVLDPDHVRSRTDCLFIPPERPDQDYTLAEEDRRCATTTRGGFTCISFTK
ncbi:hypothetical protein CRD60_04215 [Bifidobacterium aemilianum]|uniref:Methyltransferase type 11 domain-containing protein n=1 Tax=Bifidobacterium aemilianum TaxID=2493120 RepID=A0A366K905_9BIFI|nr:hypothetical protein CRD60_04215 [Bifidobacterium aemilianum]